MSKGHRSLHRRLAAVGLLAFAAIQPALVGAQGVKNDPRDSTHAQHQAPFFTKKDMFLGLSFAGATALMIPFDRHAALRLQDSSTQANHFFKQASNGVEKIASPGSYEIGA